MPKTFIPPREIKSDRLLIRPFKSVDEEQTLVEEVLEEASEDTRAEIALKNEIGCYNDHGSIFKSYAIFLRNTEKLICTITLYPVLAADGVRSEHYRKIFLPSDKSKGLGTEALASVIQNIIQPALDHTVSVSTNSDVTIMPFHGHLSLSSTDNYPSLFSNIKAGMGIDGWIAKENVVAFCYPPREDAPHLSLMKGLFKAISDYDKEPKPELKSTIIEHLHNIILSTQEPHTIISAAWVLSQKYEENILENGALCTKLRSVYNTLEVPMEDGAFSWMKKIIEQQKFHYTDEDLPYKNAICAIMPEMFIPPREILTEHLLIRPFESPEEELKYTPGMPCTIVKSKSEIGYYTPNDCPFKVYAIFLRNTKEFVGTINLIGEIIEINGKECILSSHYRNFETQYQNHGFGTEVLRTIIDKIIKPAIGRTASTSPFHCDTEITGEYSLVAAKSAPFFGHQAIVEHTNYASIFSNIKGGMSVDGVISHMSEVAMFYPPRSDSPDTMLIRDLFKLTSAYDKNPDQELKSTLMDNLHKIILSTQEPHTIISAAHILLDKCKENVSTIPELCTKLQAAYRTLDNPNSDCIFSWTQTLADLNEVHYNTENDSLYKEVMCFGESSTAASAHLD